MKLFDFGIATVVLATMLMAGAAPLVGGHIESHYIEKEALTDEVLSQYEAKGCWRVPDAGYGNMVKIACPRDKDS